MSIAKIIYFSVLTENALALIFIKGKILIPEVNNEPGRKAQGDS
jgi:hypothetical protein